MISIISLLMLTLTAAAQDLPPCFERERFIDPPWVNGLLFCLEQVIHDDSAGEMGFTALAMGDDGTLYVARPLQGQIMRLVDVNGDGLPDEAQIEIEDLTLPNALTWHEGVLYIAGGASVYRWQAGELETLVDDLPAGAGFWTGGLAIGTDERLYVASGANCDFCIPEAGRGVIYSFALDGSDRQFVAEGLRQPAALTFHQGKLWVVDSARTALFNTPDLDELNYVTPGAHFGWPYCAGANNIPDLPGEFDCTQATPPVFTFPTGSNPLALAAYPHALFPSLQNHLLVILGGTSSQVDLRGFGLVAVNMDEGGQPTGYDLVIPAETYNVQGFTLKEMNYRTSGFWPRHPFGVAVSPQGWVYVSVGGGRILVLRPVA